MDAKKTGRLISELRTEKGLTQKELASKLQVTDKAISRWETGKGYPEATIMQALSELLGISVDELLSGERKQPDLSEVTPQQASTNSFPEEISLFIKGTLALFVLLCFVRLLFPLYRAGYDSLWVLWVFPLAIGSAFVLRKKLSDQIICLITVLLLILSLILEAMPLGAVLVFANGPEINDQTLKTFSYFSPMLIGYANVSPMLAGLLTIVSLCVSVVRLLKPSKATKSKHVTFYCMLFAATFSVLPGFLFGTSYVNEISCGITALLCCCLFLL